jgi:uncharacterized membrane protein YccC
VPPYLRRILAGVYRVDWTQVHPRRAIRYAVGFGAPLFAGVAAGHTVEGVSVAGGSLLVGLTDSGAPYRGRVRMMLIATVAASVATFLGQVTGGYDVVAVLVLAIWCFGTGLTIALGLPTYFVALVSALAMVVIGYYPADALQSAEHAGLTAVGGLLQLALVLVFWGVHAHRPERVAIGRLYRSLSAWARDTSDADRRTPVLEDFTAARAALDLAQGRVAVPGESGEAFRVLVDEADRAYLDLVALRNAREELELQDPTTISAFALARETAADALAAVADALDAGRWRGDADSLRSRLDEAVDKLQAELDRRRATGDTAVANQLEAFLHRGAAMRAKLRSAVDLVVSWQGEGTPPENPVRRPRQRRTELRTRSAAAILRANLTLRSSAFRHAVRLAVATAVGAGLYRALDLWHGYWVPLTILFILRPEFGSTFTRGLQRYAGTALGVGLATVIAAALHPGPYALATITTVMAVAMFAFLIANYGVFVVSVTVFIVFMSAFAGAPEHSAALHRLIATAIGTTITLGAMALWPTWERSTLPGTVAEMIEADRAYLRAVLGAWVDPGSWDRDSERQARVRARVARTNSETALQRALDEPAKGGTGFGTAEIAGILASLRRFADGALALVAYLEDSVAATPPTGRAQLDARALANQLDAALADLAAAARQGRAPRPLPPLRATHQALSSQIGRTAPLAEETDRIVNSTVVVADLLTRAAAKGSSAAQPDAARVVSPAT